MYYSSNNPGCFTIILWLGYDCLVLLTITAANLRISLNIFVKSNRDVDLGSNPARAHRTQMYV
jgi:hypothetical protein